MINIPKKSFFGAAIGTMLEYYDYALFSTFLPILAPLFFPADTVYDSLVKSYFLLLITMLTRPLGGLLLGYLGDSLGRRKGLLASLSGIAFATIIIGITPSYASWGIWATIIIILAKSIQVFCFGGELNGAGIYVVEHAGKKDEILISALLFATTLFGSLVASFLGIILTFSFMPAWSWRIAFVLGGSLGLLGIIYRKNLTESPQFKPSDLAHQGVMTMIKKFPKELLAGIFIGGFSTVPFTTALTFICPVLMSKNIFTSHEFMLIETLLILIAIMTLVLTGFLAKEYPGKIIKWTALSLVVFSYPILLAIDQGEIILIIFALIALIIINEILLAPSNAFLKNLFPMQYRYRASSFSWGIGMSLFGGLTPIVENYLYLYTGQFTAISLWLGFIGMGTFYSVSLIREKQLASQKEHTLSNA